MPYFSVDQMFTNNQGVFKLLQYTTILVDLGKCVHLVWILGHSRVRGSEMADRAAGVAHHLNDRYAVNVQ